MSDQFHSTMTAEIRLPESGFVVEDLKAHMKAQKIPLDARLKPVLVGNAMNPNADDEVRLEAEWTT